MKTSQMLAKVKAAISDPKNWTKTVAARDSLGREISPHSKDAVCFCIIGAATREFPDFTNSVKIQDALYEELDLINESFISNFNDKHEHADVMALFDAAIARQEAKGE